MGAGDVIVVPVTNEQVIAISELMIAQQRRWSELDPRLDDVSSVDQVAAMLMQQRSAGGAPPLMVLDAHGRVRGYAHASVWSIPPEDSMLAFFTARNGAVDGLALPDPADADALAVADALLLALMRQWHDVQTLGDMFRWPCCDLWLEDLLQERGFILDSDLATRAATRLQPSTHTVSPHLYARMARPADEEALVELFTEELLFHEPYTPFVRMSPGAEHAFRARLALLWAGKSPEEDAPIVVVVERDGALVAMSENGLSLVEDDESPSFVPRGRYGYLNNVSVSRDFRGEGVGRLLVQATFDAFAAKSVEGYYLWYNPANPLSGPFWQHMGFQPLWRTYQHRHPEREASA
jgi:GNAT superfamily N-acetyltransferase